VDQTGGDWGTGIVLFDIEYEEVLGWGTPPTAAMLQISLDFYRELGRLTGKDRSGDLFYSNPNLYNPMKGMTNVAQLTVHPLAAAEYGVSAPMVGPWTDWTFWQYVGDTSVFWSLPEPGVSAGLTDLYDFHGDQAALETFLGQAPVIVPSPTLEQRVEALEAQARAHGWQV